MINSSFTKRQLRDALSAFATGVTIVTTADASGEPVGVTASSFNSVSMEPALGLWSIGKNAYSAPAFTNCEYFSIHVLRSDQIEISNTFAKSGADKFSKAAHTISDKKVPLLKDFLVRFDCKTWQVYEGGDHWIIVGEITDIVSNRGNGLVFNAGSYSTASPITPATQTQPEAQSLDAPVENLLIYNLSRAYKQMSDQFHNAVQSCGLSVAEWRVLASLQGEVTRNLPDLVTRTFIEPAALKDLLQSMQEEELCSIDNNSDPICVTGTKKGRERAQHLFELGARQEVAALGNSDDDDLNQLISLLRKVVTNTDSRS